MREAWRAVRLLVGTSVRSEPRLAALALLEPLGVLSFPFLALGLKFLTDGVVRSDVGLVVAGVALVAGIQSLMSGVVRYFGIDTRIRLQERVGFAFDREVIRLAAAVPGLEHHERPDYQDRLELIRQNQTTLSTSLDSLLGVVVSVAGAAGALVVLGLLDPVLLLFAGFVLPAVPVARLQQRWQRQAEDESAQPSRLTHHLRDLTKGRNAGMELRVFGLHELIRERMNKATLTARRPVLRAERRIAAVQLARQLLLAAGYVGAIGFMLWQTLRGLATVGDLVAAAFLCRRVAEVVVAPVFAVADLGGVVRAAGRVLWLRDYLRAAADCHGDLPPPSRLRQGIVLDRVGFTYPETGRPVLRDVCLTLPAGAVVALVGGNGAGKTTLVKLLTRMYEPTEGRILVDGTGLSTIDVDRWRARLSAAFQDFARPELSGQWAVGLGDLSRLDEAPAAAAALDRAGAGELVGALPAGLDTQLGTAWEGGVDLSTGQWQKLALGRALMRTDSLVVFFDEPTASLDAATEHALFARYAEAARRASATGAVTVLVSHRFSTVRSADLIVVLDDGQVAEVGSHPELMSRDGVYAELYRIQADSYTGKARR
jgi:ATP-binding cassette subfamily B protein